MIKKEMLSGGIIIANQSSFQIITPGIHRIIKNDEEDKKNHIKPDGIKIRSPRNYGNNTGGSEWWKKFDNITNRITED